MLMIIGGKSSSCIYPGAHVLNPKEIPIVVGTHRSVVDVVDFGSKEKVEAFLDSKKIQHPHDANRVLIAEHAYFALDGRNARSTYNNRVSDFVQTHRQWGYEHVILLTRQVAWIRKQVRDAADVAFDFSHG